MRYRLALMVLVVATVTLVFASAPASADSGKCESLLAVHLPETKIISAEAVAAGPFTPPTAAGAANAPRPIQVPAFCRVQLTIAPAIRVEVWLPATGWNGNFEAVGGGGFAGVISYPAMGVALQSGYATASTDTGHVGNDPIFALGHPELVTDYGYRAIHEMTLKAKKIIETLYGSAPRLSFFNGCSTGGRQGLTEAQRFPEDYNGILAGAPAIEWSHLQVRGLVTGFVTLKDEGSYIPASKLPAIQDASVAACDTLDGVKDGLVDDPRKCNFDPATMLCKEADSDSCLTAKQVEALKKVYSAVMYPDGKLIYPGYMPGVERGWGNFTTGPAPGRAELYNYGIGYMKYFVTGDANWDFHTWDTAKMMPLVDNPKTRTVVDSMNPDLKAYRDHGGKIIMYQGWGDDAVSPIHTINYYKSVIAALTGVGKGSDANSPENKDFSEAVEKPSNFYRLFMIPGMNHCGGGSGPNTFDGMSALAGWVEKKQAPEKIIATHITNGSPDRARPLCPYPQSAHYTGQGSIDDAANFVCRAPSSK